MIARSQVAEKGVAVWQRLTLFTHGSICKRPCRHLDIEDLWHMSGDVDWVKCRKAFVNGELQCPPDAIKQIKG